jgi:hypothetical protein
MAYSLLLQQHLGRDVAWAKNGEGKIWYFIDELPTLPKLPNLIKTIPVLREKGACIITASQDPAQLISKYGEHDSKILVGQCSTKVFFRTDDSEWVSKLLGNKEEQITRYGTSSTDQRDSMMRGTEGSSTSMDLRTVPVVLPGEVTALKRFDQVGYGDGFLVCSGVPVTRAAWPPVFVNDIAEEEVTADWIDGHYSRRPASVDSDPSAKAGQGDPVAEEKKKFRPGGLIRDPAATPPAPAEKPEAKRGQSRGVNVAGRGR